MIRRAIKRALAAGARIFAGLLEDAEEEIRHMPDPTLRWIVFGAVIVVAFLSVMAALT